MRLHFIFWALIPTCVAFSQNLAIGIKPGLSFSKLSVEYDYPVGNKSRNSDLTPVQSLFVEWKASKFFFIEADLGYKKKQAHLDLTWKRPTDPFQPDLLREVFGELQINQFFISVLPQLRTSLGKHYFGFVHAGIIWNRIVYEAYPCCIDNRSNIGENLSSFETSIGGGVGLNIHDSFTFSLDFQSLKSIPKSDSYQYEPRVNFDKDLLVSAKIGLFIK
ncbi:MAG: outer membrane beta-barrel protein [Bacteroidetes bacterium]|nr:outer membrane beta-barrel protein [Bacteroidota bacterium]